MLLLTSTSGQLNLQTTTGALIDVHATYVDTSGVTITPGRKNTAITAAATSVIVASPAASTQRNIKTVHCRNKDPALACTLILQVFDGASTFPLYQAVLNPGDMLELTDMGGFQVARA